MRDGRLILHNLCESYILVVGVHLLDYTKALFAELRSIADPAPVDGHIKGVLEMFVVGSVVLLLNLWAVRVVLDHVGPVALLVMDLPFPLVIVEFHVTDMRRLGSGDAMKRYRVLHNQEPAGLVVGQEVGEEARLGM